ncbi:uncharacterized protein BJ171DRAFT_503937 [Polychytrium aggregatum]|uniref:uncharacterized protein n=1 Tax=Polychytrium aggregatum TaxID=110093 RepID=UPI0022FEF004|nr:uncharacterized protein BJ171DRAFT_503937 [Polychytrium aggregatum]KAI9204877.1 hypothetical protein BJ171DRAFT_503937 [Polychytrium aggregatum]
MLSKPQPFPTMYPPSAPRSDAACLPQGHSDLLLAILALLPPVDRLRCRRISRRFNSLVCLPAVWSKLELKHLDLYAVTKLLEFAFRICHGSCAGSIDDADLPPSHAKVGLEGTPQPASPVQWSLSISNCTPYRASSSAEFETHIGNALPFLDPALTHVPALGTAAAAAEAPINLALAEPARANFSSHQRMFISTLSQILPEWGALLDSLTIAACPEIDRVASPLFWLVMKHCKSLRALEYHSYNERAMTDEVIWGLTASLPILSRFSSLDELSHHGIYFVCRGWGASLTSLELSGSGMSKAHSHQSLLLLAQYCPNLESLALVEFEGLDDLVVKAWLGADTSSTSTATQATSTTAAMTPATLSVTTAVPSVPSSSSTLFMAPTSSASSISVSSAPATDSSKMAAGSGSWQLLESLRIVKTLSVTSMLSTTGIARILSRLPRLRYFGFETTFSAFFPDLNVWDDPVAVQEYLALLVTLESLPTRRPDCRVRIADLTSYPSM